MSDLWPLALMRARSDSTPTSPVVRPQTPAEVCQLLREGRRLVPRGGASGVCGAVAPEPGDLVVDLTALNEIEVDEANLLVRAQAGVKGIELERRLNQRGLTLGHFPSSLPAATVGGLVSTRSCGQESTRYGGIEEMVIGLTVALPGGGLARARVVPRSAAGPPLHQMFVGAEGGLGVVLEAVLRVHRLPEAVIGRGWRLGTLTPGLQALREAMQSGLRPLVLRLHDATDSALQGEREGLLLLGATAGPRRLAEVEAELLAELIEGIGRGTPLGEEPWQRWLRHRFDLSAERLRELLEPPGSYLDTVELGCTWSQLPALHAQVMSHLERCVQLAMCHFSHPSAHGCCAYFTFGGTAPDEQSAELTYREAWRGTMEAALAHGATITHHHGVGRARAAWVREELGGWWQVWEAVRFALDPDRRMNPSAVGESQIP